MQASSQLNNLSIPKPCHAAWGDMMGDDRKRFCDSCRKTVHDLSHFTRKEATKLLRNSRGGFCARISYDAQGRVEFLPEPETRTFGRLVRLSLLGASALGTQAMAFAQSPSDGCKLEVKVTDASSAGVPGAKVSIASRQEPQAPQQGKTDTSGVFRDKLTPGSYDLRVEMPGFQTYVSQDLNLSCEDQTPAAVDVQLRLGALMGDVVMVSTDPPMLQPTVRKRSFFRRLLSTDIR